MDIKRNIIYLGKLKAEIGFTILFGVVLTLYLFIPPQIGLADSADFGRITSRIGLHTVEEKPADQYFNFFTTEYKIVHNPKVPVNLGQVFGLFSLCLSKIFQRETYSIFYLSFIYFVLYVGGFHLFIRNSFYYFTG